MATALGLRDQAELYLSVKVASMRRHHFLTQAAKFAQVTLNRVGQILTAWPLRVVPVVVAVAKVFE